MTKSPTSKPRPETKNAKAKRAIRCLATSIAVPMAITMTMILLFGSSQNQKYRAMVKTRPFWLAPLWVIHLASLGSSFLMGLAAWLVWADGGLNFHSEALPLYIAQFSLSILWNPLVLVIGAVWLAFVFCFLHFGTLFACYFCFGRVNPFARDLVLPCLVWVAYLCIVSFKLIYL